MKNLFFLAITICLLTTSCNVEKGEGPIVTEELNIQNFAKFVLDSSFDVYITQGNEQKVEAKGQANIINALKTNVNNNTFTGDLKNGAYSEFDLTMYITVPDLESIVNDGSGTIFLTSLTTEDLDLKISGSGDIKVSDLLDIEDETKLEIDGSGNLDITELQTKDVYIDIDGSGEIFLTGAADDAELNLDGSGDFVGFTFECNNYTVNSDGNGDAEIFVNNELVVNIDGSGDVKYKGDPNIQVSDDGSGRLIDAN